jgi:hypothetical protein
VAGCFERLEWPASWQAGDFEDGYQFALLLQEQLMVNISCLGEIVDALRALQSAQCCDFGALAESTGLPVVPQEPDDYEYREDSPPDGAPSWDDWDDNYCVRAQWFVDAIGDVLEKSLSDAAVVGGMSAAILSGALLLSGVGVPVLVLGALVGALASVLAAEAAEDLIEDFDGIRSNLICALIDVNTPADAKVAWDAVVDANVSTELHAYIIKNLASQEDVNRLWDDAGIDTVGYSSSSCAPCYSAICEGDCGVFSDGSCGGPCGIVTSGSLCNEGTVVIQSVAYTSGNCMPHNGFSVRLCGSDLQSNRWFRFTDLGSWSLPPQPCASNTFFYQRNVGGSSEVIRIDGPPIVGQWYCGYFVSLWGSGAWTVEMELGAPCEVD